MKGDKKSFRNVRKKKLVFTSTVNRFDSFWEASESGFSKSGVNVSFSFPWMKKILGPLSILETVDFFKDGVEVNLPLENDRMVVEILC